MVKKLIGKKLKATRLKNDMTIQELAERSRVSSNMISRIERGLTIPSVEILMKLAGCLRHEHQFLRRGGGQRDDRRPYPQGDRASRSSSSRTNTRSPASPRGCATRASPSSTTPWRRDAAAGRGGWFIPEKSLPWCSADDGVRHRGRPIPPRRGGLPDLQGIPAASLAEPATTGETIGHVGRIPRPQPRPVNQADDRGKASPVLPLIFNDYDCDLKGSE